jgi:tRNA-uridine 2-sulfurtransferase
LRIGHPAPDGRPRYVLDIRPVDATVVVGPVEALDVRRLVGERARWCGVAPLGPTEVLAQVRAHGEAVPAVAEAAPDGSLTVELREPLRGVAAGQAVVLYSATRVLGSATVTSASR